MTPRFKRAYDLLIKAYFNDQLMAGDCRKCAVGNICEGWSGWFGLFSTFSGEQFYNLIADAKYPIIASLESQLFERTQYNRYDLAKIEYAFETTCKLDHFDSNISRKAILEDQFNGLKAVIELLMSFDQIEGDQYVEKLKEKLTAPCL